jgi:hypothetical protein
MLPENRKAIELMRNLGFKLKYMEDGTIRGILSLKEEEQPTIPAEEKAKVQETIATVERAANKEAEAEKAASS